MLKRMSKRGMPIEFTDSLDFEVDIEEKQVDSWYATGSFTISSNSYFFKTWVLLKSVIYLVDLY